MTNITIDIPSYSGYDCYFSSLLNLMFHANLQENETNLYFYCQGMHTQYYEETNQLLGAKKVIHSELAEKSVIITEYPVTRSDELLLLFYELINNSRLPLLYLNTEGLDYHRIYKDNKGREHCIIVNGIDLDKKLIHIYDSHIRDYSGRTLVYKGTTDFSKLASCIESMYSYDFSLYQEISSIELWAKIINGLKSFIGTRGGNGIHYGIQALHAYIDNVSRLSHLSGDTFKEACIDVNYNIKLLAFTQVLDFVRYLFTDNSLYRFQGYSETVQSLNEIHSSWNKVGLLILKTGVTGNKNSIDNIITQCHDILEKEENILIQFLDQVTSLIV